MAADLDASERTSPFPWWPSGLDGARFTSDGDALQGTLDEKWVRIDLRRPSDPPLRFALANGEEMIAASQDGSHLLVSEGQGISLADRGQGTRQALGTGAAWAFRPDGKQVAGGHPLQVRDMQGNTLAQANPSPEPAAANFWDRGADKIAYSPDGKWLAYVSPQIVTIYQAESLQEKFRIPRDDVHQVTFDDTSRYLAVVNSSRVLIYDLQAGPPDPGPVDALLYAETWTGWRLSTGGALPLDAHEHWQRRQRVQREQKLGAWSTPDLWPLAYPTALVVIMLGLYTVGSTRKRSWSE
ncbi:PD40 domain-containing protein [bacterium]|nr:PD40 domain-containing protein [bacterium]